MDLEHAQQKYNEIVNIGVLRKKELFGDDNELTYYQLRRLIIKLKEKYEIHHIIPRYKLKHLPSKHKNAGSNLTVLTPKEHLLCHYYLSKFDTKDVYKARMAFIQLFNFKDRKCIEMSEAEILDLADKIAETRKMYFGSSYHRENSSRSGKLAGERRKERMRSDPEFRAYIISKWVSKESTLKSLATKQNGLYKLPPWERRCKTTVKQRWDLFDTVFVGVVEFDSSYKYIANYLGISSKSIFNIVRIIKDNPEIYLGKLENFKWYNNWLEEFNPNISLVYNLRIMLDCPWNYKYFRSLRNLDRAYTEYRNNGRLSCDLLKSIGVIPMHHKKYRDYCKEIYKFGEFELWPYYTAWKLQRDMITSEFPTLNVHYTEEDNG